MFPAMLLLPLLDAKVWYGPVSVTFIVQFPGDPFDPLRNDIRVRFTGSNQAQAESVAAFDPELGAWRAVLYTDRPGEYQARLVRNGKETEVQPEEGKVEARRMTGLGYLVPNPSRKDRRYFDTDEIFVGVGVDLGVNASAERVERLADAGATWIRVAAGPDPFSDENLGRLSHAIDAAERRGVNYSFDLGPETADRWRAYALARFGSSPRLIGWEAPTPVRDVRDRPQTPLAQAWDALFRNEPGPFKVPDDDQAFSRIRALKKLLEISDWANWKAPKLYENPEADGVAESDRLIARIKPDASLVQLPLSDGMYDGTLIDLATGETIMEKVEVKGGRASFTNVVEMVISLRRNLD